MKTRSLFLASICALTLACEDKPTTENQPESTAVEAGWEASVAFIEGREGASVKVKTPSQDDFSPWRGGQPIPPGSIVQTAAGSRARIAVDGGIITLNHDTQVVFDKEKERTVRVLTGHAVLDMDPERESKTTIELPTGSVILHGTKVSAVAGEKESIVSVSQGEIAVKFGDKVVEALPGQEIVLPASGPPRLAGSADLSREMGWSELVDPDDTERIEVDRGLGKLVGKTPGGEREWKLDLVKHDINVKVQGNMAYTEIHESFKNPTGQTLEGVYRFPLPADAQISRLSLKVGNKWMEGEFVETKRAEWIWRDIINQWRDPAMLKWKQGNTFELRIFPINPRDVREIKIGYVQELKPSSGGGYAYTYPMPVDYAGTIKAGSFNIDATIYDHDATQPIEVGGYAASVTNGATDDDRAKTKITYAAKDFYAAGDFSIDFRRKDIKQVSGYAYRPNNRREKSYGLVAIRPEFPVQKTLQGRDFVIVADTSYTRRGGVMQLQRSLVPRIIDEMDPLDRVATMQCATRCLPVGKTGFQNPNDELADTVKSGLSSVNPQGTSNALEPIRIIEQLAMNRSGSDRTRPLHIIYLTDGMFSAGEIRPGKLAEAARSTLLPLDARMSIVDLGGDNDPSLQEALATAGRGSVVSLDAAQSRTGQALSILSHHYGATLTDVTVDVPGMQDVLPNSFPALASGQELTLVGRFTGEVKGDVIVRGKLGSETFEKRYPIHLKPGKTNSFVPRSWAVRKIRDLELDGESNKNEIVRLSQEFGVLTRFTTLLALESEDMMREYGVKKRNKNEDWDGEGAEQSNKEAEKRATRDQGKLADTLGQLGTGGAPAQPMRPMEEANEPMPESEPEPMPDPKPQPMTTSKSPKKKRKSSSTRSKSGDGIDSLLNSNDRSGGGRKDMKAERKVSKPKMDDADLDMFGGDDSIVRPTPRPRPRRRYRRKHRVTVADIRPARDATRSELSRIDQRSTQLASDPNNRSKRMRLIRTQIRANELSGAERQIESWIGMNPMDAEALVQKAQLLSHRGQMKEALELLESAADAQSRGKWIQERLGMAYRSLGESQLACAQEVTLVGATGKGDANIADCGIVSDLGAFELPVADTSSVKMRDDKPSDPRGQLKVELTWTGQGDLDILLVEPDGRTLSWLSQRRRVKSTNVRAPGREVLAVPSTRNGTWGIKIVRADGGQSALNATVKVTSHGKTKTFDVRHAQTSLDVAEVEISRGWR